LERVQIQIQTKMELQGQSIEQVCYGKLFVKEEGWNLVYQEDMGDNHKVSTTIKAENGMATIIRTGAVRMRQEYKPGQLTEGKYEGPFGMMWMETQTEEVRWEERLFFLSYLLKLNGEDMGRYKVAMKMEVLG